MVRLMRGLVAGHGMSRNWPTGTQRYGHDQTPSHVTHIVSHQTTDAQTGHPTRPQATHEPEAYPRGYVEDSCESRTQLVARFSIRLKEPLTTKKERPRHARMSHTQTNTPLSLIDKVLLIQQINDVKSQQEFLSFPR